jgi:PAS domain-containing protein
MNTDRRERTFVMATAAVSLAIAALLAWLVVRDVNADLREIKLQQVRLAAAAINPLHLATLTGTAADITNPAYQQLKTQMQGFKNAGKNYRFAYLLGRHPDGRVFFYMDNEAPDSRDHSPPGQIYKEASPELQQIFTTGKELVEGPLPDAWGTWVTPLVPVRDPVSGTIRAVFGMDIGVEGWYWEIVSRAALPVLLMLFLVLLLDHWLLSARSRALHRVSEEQHRIFFTDSPDACLTISADLVTDCNHAAEQLFVSGRAGIIGKTLPGLLPPLQPNGTSPEYVTAALLATTPAAGSRLAEYNLLPGRRNPLPRGTLRLGGTDRQTAGTFRLHP